MALLHTPPHPANRESTHTHSHSLGALAHQQKREALADVIVKGIHFLETKWYQYMLE